VNCDLFGTQVTPVQVQHGTARDGSPYPALGFLFGRSLSSISPTSVSSPRPPTPSSLAHSVIKPTSPCCSSHPSVCNLTPRTTASLRPAPSSPGSTPAARTSSVSPMARRTPSGPPSATSSGASRLPR
jgi:hypothetical protein